MSMTSGFCSSMVWSGAAEPAAAQAWERAVARARPIAVRAVSASAANTLIRRETVGSEAIVPKSSG